MTLPAGLKPDVIYGIQHVKTGLFLASTSGLDGKSGSTSIKKDNTIGVFSTGDEIFWDPNSMFMVEEGGSAQGDNAQHYNDTIRIKTYQPSFYVTANGKYSAGDGQTELVLRDDMGKNGDEQMKQKFVVKDLGAGKVRLGGFWNEAQMFLFWKVGTLHHGPNRIATLHTKGDAVNKNYPTVLNRGYYLDGAALPNDEFQFVPISQIPQDKIKKTYTNSSIDNKTVTIKGFTTGAGLSKDPNAKFHIKQLNDKEFNIQDIKTGMYLAAKKGSNEVSWISNPLDMAYVADLEIHDLGAEMEKMMKGDPKWNSLPQSKKDEIQKIIDSRKGQFGIDFNEKDTKDSRPGFDVYYDVGLSIVNKTVPKFIRFGTPEAEGDINDQTWKVEIQETENFSIETFDSGKLKNSKFLMFILIFVLILILVLAFCYYKKLI